MTNLHQTKNEEERSAEPNWPQRERDVNADKNGIVDLTPEIDAIKRRYGPRYFVEPSAIAEAAALWGVVCNDCGVLVNVASRLRVEHGRYRATLRVYQTAEGYWHTAVSLSMPEYGFGSPATVWDALAYGCGLAARRNALRFLLERRAPCDRRSDAELNALRAQVEAELTPHLSLF